MTEVRIVLYVILTRRGRICKTNKDESLLQIGLTVSTSFEARSWELNMAKNGPKQDYVDALKCWTVLGRLHSYREKNTFADQKKTRIFLIILR
jgi:hypothetical protein